MSTIGGVAAGVGVVFLSLISHSTRQEEVEAVIYECKKQLAVGGMLIVQCTPYQVNLHPFVSIVFQKSTFQ
jgi:hypothetical protein